MRHTFLFIAENITQLDQFHTLVWIQKIVAGVYAPMVIYQSATSNDNFPIRYFQFEFHFSCFARNYFLGAFLHLLHVVQHHRMTINVTFSANWNQINQQQQLQHLPTKLSHVMVRSQL